MAYSCAGETLVLKNINNLTISDTTLYGCGTIGLYGRQLHNVTCTEMTITHCSDVLMDLAYSSEVLFQSCEFVNRRNEDVYLDELTDVRFDQCQLVGGSANPPNIYYGGSIIVETDERDEWSSIEDFSFEGVSFSGLSSTGNTMIAEIENLYKGLNVELDHGMMEISGEPTSFCTLKYTVEPPIEEMYNHRLQAKEIISKFYENSDEAFNIYLLQVYGELSIVEGMLFERGVVIDGGLIDVAAFLNQNVIYLTYDEGKAIVRNSLVTSYLVGDSGLVLTEDDVEVTVDRTVIYEGDVYYVYDIKSKLEQAIEYRDIYVNAISGGAYVEFDMYHWHPFEQPSQKMILDYMADTKGTSLSKDSEKVVFYLIKGDILSVQFDSKWPESYTVISNNDGSYKFETYYEFEGD